jgi:hypothetical protein
MQLDWVGKNVISSEQSIFLTQSILRGVATYATFYVYSEFSDKNVLPTRDKNKVVSFVKYMTTNVKVNEKLQEETVNAYNFYRR